MRWAHLDLAGPLTSPPHGLHARLEGVELREEHFSLTIPISVILCNSHDRYSVAARRDT